MQTVTRDIRVRRGATLTRTWTLTIDGTPVDLTGYTARLQIRATALDTAHLLHDATPAIAPTTGAITLAMPAAETAALPTGSWPYDLKLTGPSGAVAYLLAGWVIVDPRVTL